MDVKQVLFRVYKGKAFADWFLVIKSIFEDLNTERSIFVDYKGVGHEVTKEIEQDELEFFKSVLND